MDLNKYNTFTKELDKIAKYVITLQEENEGLHNELGRIELNDSKVKSEINKLNQFMMERCPGVAWGKNVIDIAIQVIETQDKKLKENELENELKLEYYKYIIDGIVNINNTYKLFKKEGKL